jgi:hypothetical protein
MSYAAYFCLLCRVLKIAVLMGTPANRRTMHARRSFERMRITVDRGQGFQVNVDTIPAGAGLDVPA